MNWRVLTLAAVLAILTPATATRAQSSDTAEPPPFPEFTFKRTKVPKPGAKRLITVQIDPTKPVVTANPAPAAPVLPSSDVLAWYWAGVSPALKDSVPGRLPAAILQLGKGKGVPTPRLDAMKRIAETYGTDILKATIGTRVSPALVLAVIGIESSGRPDAVSTAGASGLMQLMPDTATRFGVTDIADTTQNIRGGVAYLDWLMGEFGDDPIMVLAGYNAGEGAVRKHAGVPPYAETRAYVPKVLAAWTVARGLCKTPPELITDGCAFAVAGKL